MFLIESRLVVEQIHLGRSARLKKVNDPFRFSQEVSARQGRALIDTSLQRIHYATQGESSQAHSHLI